jgi:hypothetical protein
VSAIECAQHRAGVSLRDRMLDRGRERPIGFLASDD